MDDDTHVPTGRRHNKYRGFCCRCYKPVKPGAGYAEHGPWGWRVIHEECDRLRAEGVPYVPRKKK